MAERGGTTLASQMYLQRDMTADPMFRRSVLAFRWLLLVLWVGLIQNRRPRRQSRGLAVQLPHHRRVQRLPHHPRAQLSETNESRRSKCSYRYADIVTITVAMVALHDVRNPVWAIYFLSIVGFAHFITRREMAVYVRAG